MFGRAWAIGQRRFTWRPGATSGIDCLHNEYNVLEYFHSTTSRGLIIVNVVSDKRRTNSVDPDICLVSLNENNDEIKEEKAGLKYKQKICDV